MKRDPGGTLTTICMLIPMVAIPWFAIRGTQDLPSFENQAGQTETELSYTDFEPRETELPDAPPFPDGSSQVLTAGSATEDEIEWDPFEPGSPFDPAPSATPSDEDVKDGSLFSSDPHNGLEAKQLRPGSPSEVASIPPSTSKPEVPTQRASQSQPAAKSVTEQWKAIVRQLEGEGMRNYRVETTEDRTRYYFTAFFQDGPTLRRRIEGQGKHPLTALQDALRQVREMRLSQ